MVPVKVGIVGFTDKPAGASERALPSIKTGSKAIAQTVRRVGALDFKVLGVL